MNVLFIGGTGTISAAISRRVVELGWDLWLLNRGTRSPESWNAPPGPGAVHQIDCDISNEEEAKKKLGSLDFDVAADFIAYTPEQVRRDHRLLAGKTGQYFFISSASAYQKPLSSCYVTEGTPLANPYWEYSRQKIACEDLLWSLYRNEGFPMTIVRPSHTYDERSVPLGVHGKHGSWQVLKRIMEGKEVIIHGDGSSLWTMTHNSDFAVAFTGLMGNIHALGEAVQITSSETLCWNQIYQVIANALNKPLKAVHVSSEFLSRAGPGYDFLGGLTGDKAVSVIFDNSKLKRLVPGFCAKIRFDEGIRNTIAYILGHPELQVPDPDFDRFCDRLIAVRERALKELTG
ncbi:MAG: NAD-dependent epimerase/dehydratase family protein [Spirochaetaceae bacterium]|jgi:nucleoside-diphosphate-sugar epimerase|nr:NAD-dependent epimerase/dehydratase family protein [Spirochaetaceae bacterium]